MSRVCKNAFDCITSAARCLEKNGFFWTWSQVSVLVSSFLLFCFVFFFLSSSIND